MSETLPAHSPVGGSTAKRLLKCPASVGLAVGIEDDESEHAALGTAVHSLIERCFRTNTDAWQHIGFWSGQYVGDSVPVPWDKQMANGAQVMLDAVRKAHPDRNQGNFWVERQFHRPNLHPLCLGTSDAVYLDEVDISDPACPGPVWWRTLHIWDYKNGAGVVIEVPENEQEMYYACGILDDMGLWNLVDDMGLWDLVDEVVLHIVQPNGFHWDGPVREWKTTPAYLRTWLDGTLLPGIRLAIALAESGTPEEQAKHTISGEHCRFCPVRAAACPQLMDDMKEFHAMLDTIAALPRGADELTNDQLSRFLNLNEVAKIVVKAAGSTAFKRINGGGRVPGWKLVKARSNRALKERQRVKMHEGDDVEMTVEEAAAIAFKGQEWTKPELKSAAQLDELPGGVAFTTLWAFKPDNGLTLSKDSDGRREVSKDTQGLFKPVEAPPVAEVVPPAPAGPVKRRGSLAP